MVCVTRRFLPFIFKKPEWEGGPTKKIPKIQDPIVKIRDYWGAEKLAAGESGAFAGEFEDFRKSKIDSKVRREPLEPKLKSGLSRRSAT